MKWIKVKFSDFLKERKGRYKPSDIAIKDLKRIEKIDFSGNIFLSNKPSNTDMILVKDGDLVISGINVEKGAMNIFHGKDDVVATIHYSSYTYDENVIDLEYLKHFLKSKKFRDVLKEQVPGGIKTEIKPKHLLPLEIGIPKQIEDQKNIVKKLEKLNLEINSVSTEISFQLEVIKNLRQAFLREAMQGKLVSNETSDGKTGADLLQEIQVEKEKLIKEQKIKKSKPLPPISDDEIPFEIPENWIFCKLGELFQVVRGSSPRPKGDIRYFPKERTPYHWITIADFAKNSIGNVLMDTNQFLTYEGSKQSRFVTPKDLLVAASGVGSVGKSSEIGISGYIYDGLMAIKNISNDTIKKYLSFYLKVKELEIYDIATGANWLNINTDLLNNYILPLPPLEIQEVIVSKLNELMNYCDELERSVIESKKHNEQLLQQVLREALEGKNEVENGNLQSIAEEPPIYSIQNTINKNCDTGDMAILAGYIIKKLSTQNSKDFGRVKLQKMLHLVEYHCQLSSELKYQKNVAGPYAWELEHVIEPKLKSLRFFEIKKDKFGATSKVTYTSLSASNELPSLFKREFKDQAESISNLLDKFQDKNWEFCEMISTMYAVWNNRLINKELFTDEILKQDFLAWDDKKKRFIDQLDYALEWIRKEKIEPVGFGEYIDKK